MSKIGLVLSGGGTRCIAHLGIIKALNEFDIHPNIISGTSGGAAVGAFLTKGYSPEKITEIIKNGKLFDFKHFLFGKAGLFNMSLFENLILEHFPENTFESLKIPLVVNATDIINGVPIYFSKGQLSTAIIASSCIPVIFEPIEYNGYLLVDGGVLNNLPIEPIIDQCDKLIGIHVNSVSTRKKDLRMKDMLDRSFHFALRSSIIQKINLCDLFLEPPHMTQYGMFDFEKSEEIFNYAYQYAIDQKESILAFKAL
ncbi:MAG: patatin-like phospholipase family protein [bacterium]|nr:patatin-like phospholipase family protein [bacterium]